MITFTLIPKRERLPLSHHPWIFSGAISSISAEPEFGEIVRVETHDGRFIAYAHHNPQSKLRLRLLEWNEERTIDLEWWIEKLTLAFSLRLPILNDNTTTARMVFGENDFLPGLIVDKFDDYLVVQYATAGMTAAKTTILDALIQSYKNCFGNDPQGIIERSDSDGCALEGLESSTGLLWGSLPEDNTVEVKENGFKFLVDLYNGQKTGFYTDQRDNRLAITPWMKDRNVLDICCYTGAFSIYGLGAGAKSITLVDASQVALKQAEKNISRNNPEVPVNFIEANAFNFLRAERKKGQSDYDMIILDPPKLVPNRHELKNGLRGYKDLNMQAIAILPPGGFLATFSCSGTVSMEQFRETVVFAAKDVGRQVKIIKFLHQSSCHPVCFSFPEGEYLKGLLIQVF